MKRLEEQITALESVILNVDFTQDLTDGMLERKVEIYKKLTATHVAYIESIRRTLTSIDLMEMMKAFGILELYEKFRVMKPGSIDKISAMLESK